MIQKTTWRVSIPSGSLTNSGQWLVQVIHRGGVDQDFSIVMTGDASIVARPDIYAFSDSIFLSSESPLQNDIVSVRVSWMNQGTADAGSFDWKLEDLTMGTILFQGQSNGVASSGIESKITTHSFSTTGLHTLKLTLDTNNVLNEMNDESSGINNNVLEIEIEVTALGVRVIPLDGEGNIPTSEEDRQQAAINVFDVRMRQKSIFQYRLEMKVQGQRWLHYHTPMYKKNIRYSTTLSHQRTIGRREYLKLDLTNFRRKVNRVMTFKFP